MRASPKKQEEGGRVYEIHSSQSTVRSGYLRNSASDTATLISPASTSATNCGRRAIRNWIAACARVLKANRRSSSGAIELEVHGLAGKPLTLIARDEFGTCGETRISDAAGRKRRNSRSRKRKLREQLGRLGGTPFKLGELKNFLVGDVLLPVSELNRLRREAVAELERLRARPKPWTLSDDRRDAETQRISDTGNLRVSASLTVQLRIDRPGPQPCATRSCACDCGVDDDLLRLREPKEISRRSHAVSHGARLSTGNSCNQQSAVFVAPPRIFKMGEEWTLEQVRSCNADGYLVRNYDHLKFFANDRRVGDFSLNIANRLAADYFKNKFGLERVTASYDLNFQQLEALAASRAAGMVRGHDSSAHADVSHGALRVLRVSVQRHGLHELRPALRRARREAARPGRRGASGEGRCGLPQHCVQCAGADRRGIRRAE